MSKIISLLFLVAFLLACSDERAVIEGTLPSDEFDKQVVFWVPWEGEHPKPVDSTHINKNKFRLVISKRNLNKMGIVRVRPEYRFDLQDILVFSEPGTIFVNFNNNSSASGTPLNQVLQQWKDNKFYCDSTNYSLYSKLNDEKDETEKARIRSEMDDNRKQLNTFLDSLVEKNKDNPVGQLINSLLTGKVTGEN